jgi:mannitol-specific phosphotransferase system IIBC component
MAFVGLILLAVFPVLASRRFEEGGLRSLGSIVLLAWAVITAAFLLLGEVPRGRSALVELVAYGAIWTLPLLVGSTAIVLGVELKISRAAQMALAYVAQCLAIVPALWLALAACVQIRGPACTAP